MITNDQEGEIQMPTTALPTQQGSKKIKINSPITVLKSPKTIIPLQSTRKTFQNGYCGYCHQNGSTKLIITPISINPTSYDNLYNKGWVKLSGKMYYQYAVQSCCAWYNFRIRVKPKGESGGLEMNKQQKKYWKKWQKFLDGKRAVLAQENKEKKREVISGSGEDFDEIMFGLEKILDQVYEIFEDFFERELVKKVLIEKKTVQVDQKRSKVEDKLVYFSSVFLKIFGMNKVKEGRKSMKEREDLREKLRDLVQENLEKFEVEIGKDSFIRFKKIKEEIKEDLEKEELIIQEETEIPKPIIGNVENQQGHDEISNIIIHDDNSDKLEIISTAPFNPHEKKKRNFVVKLESNKATAKKYQLYKRYSKFVHGNLESFQEYERFICNQVYRKEEHEGAELGSFNLCYYLDDHLVGVSVVDLMPSGLVSYYVFFEPLLKSFSFGTITVFLEAQFIRERQLTVPEFKYQYLGYYIHNCRKMNYKGNFRKCEAFCPLANTWVELDDDLKEKLDIEGQVRLTEDYIPDLGVEDQFSADKDIFMMEVLSLVNCFAYLEDLEEKYGSLMPDRLEIYQYEGRAMAKLDNFNGLMMYTLVEDYGELMKVLGKKSCSEVWFLYE